MDTLGEMQELCQHSFRNLVLTENYPRGGDDTNSAKETTKPKCPAFSRRGDLRCARRMMNE